MVLDLASNLQPPDSQPDQTWHKYFGLLSQTHQVIYYMLPLYNGVALYFKISLPCSEGEVVLWFVYFLF